MKGVFTDARVDITSVADGVHWSIDAKELSYQLESDGAVMLRILMHQKHLQVARCEQREGATSDQSVDVAAEAVRAIESDVPHAATPSVEHRDTSKEEPIAVSAHTACEELRANTPRTPMTHKEGFLSGSVAGSRSGDVLHSAAHNSPRAPPRSVDRSTKAQTQVSPASTNAATPSAASGQACRPADVPGPAGYRCVHHNAPAAQCNVDGCSTFTCGKVITQDIHGPAGYRCAQHGTPASHYAVDACTSRPSSTVIDSKDGTQERAGTKRTHPGSSVNPRTVDECSKAPRSKVRKTDGDGVRIGRRGFPRGGHGRRCNVHGCNTFSKGKVRIRDCHGEPGNRCVRHGAIVDVRLCSVEGCTTRSRRRVEEPDLYGAPGYRCARHSSEKAAASSLARLANPAKGKTPSVTRVNGSAKTSGPSVARLNGAEKVADPLVIRVNEALKVAEALETQVAEAEKVDAPSVTHVDGTQKAGTASVTRVDGSDTPAGVSVTHVDGSEKAG